jgi:hypothetical protein
MKPANIYPGIFSTISEKTSDSAPDEKTSPITDASVYPKKPTRFRVDTTDETAINATTREIIDALALETTPIRICLRS